MFNIYINDLSEDLSSPPFGCYINDVCFNHLFYADDAVLISPYPAALQTLLDSCGKFIKDNDLRFNIKKSKSMMIPVKKFIDLAFPTFYIDVLTNVSSEKYLGYNISVDCRDDDSISNVIRGLYARGNMLKRNFIQCDIPVKLQLFQAYCSSFYCCSLWTNYTHNAIQRMKVCHNNILRHFISVERSASVSQQFVKNGLNNFNVLRRKFVFSLWKRVMTSQNSLVSTIVNSV